MKRVLIITYHFPPRPGIAPIRPAGLAKYLPEYGWEPIILTARFPGRPQTHLRVIEVPSRKVLWRVCGQYAARRVVREEKIKAVISIYRPPAGHFIAAALKKEFPGLTWIADFRDLWTQNHAYNRRGLRRFLEKRQEARTLQNADALTTVSEPWVQKLKDRYQKPSFAIPNGFDLAIWSTESFRPNKRFTVTYTGGIYFGKKAQDVIPFLNALKSLVTEGLIRSEDAEVNFYGDRKTLLDAAIKKTGLKKIVVQHGFIPREEVLEKQRQSQLLLLLDWNDPGELGVCPGKLFEYFAARRPILSVGGCSGVARDLLEETKAGFCCRTEAEIKTVLLQSYREFREKGSVSYQGKETAIMRYSQRVMAEKFAEILNKSGE
jgi:glycosyltransferase involved in cell wall biosynthesis